MSVRHRLTRGILKELLKTTRLEKITLLLPFIVAIIDAEIFYYSLKRGEEMIIIFSAFVLFLSVLEIIAVIEEIKIFIERARRREKIEEMIFEIAKKMERPTVKKIIDKFMEENKGYSYQEIYPIVCHVIELLKKD